MVQCWENPNPLKMVSSFSPWPWMDPRLELRPCIFMELLSSCGPSALCRQSHPACERLVRAGSQDCDWLILGSFCTLERGTPIKQSWRQLWGTQPSLKVTAEPQGDILVLNSSGQPEFTRRSLLLRRVPAPRILPTSGK